MEIFKKMTIWTSPLSLLLPILVAFRLSSQREMTLTEGFLPATALL